MEHTSVISVKCRYAMSKYHTPLFFYLTVKCDPIRKYIQTLGSLKNDDGNGNKNGKNAIGLDWQNNNFARASCFFVYFFVSYDVKLTNFTFY